MGNGWAKHATADYKYFVCYSLNICNIDDDVDHMMLILLQSKEPRRAAGYLLLCVTIGPACKHHLPKAITIVPAYRLKLV